MIPIKKLLCMLLSSMMLGVFSLAWRCGQEEKIGLVKSSMEEKNLINKDGSVHPSLLKLLDLYGLQHDGTVESINKAMQASFLRKSGKERRDLADTSLDQKVKEQAMPCLMQMGFVEAIPHTEINADYFLLFGAMIGGIERRFRDFMEQYSQGTLHCKNLVLLGGTRALRAHEIKEMKQALGVENFAKFLKKVQKIAETALTETDLFRFFWETYATEKIKERFKEGEHLFFVNDTNTAGTNHRPTTQTTLEAWYKNYHPTPGSCHANVEQPYGMRMEKQLRLFLAQQAQRLEGNSYFSITWNSPRASKGLCMAVYKDELAREFYMELQLRNFLLEKHHQ